MPGSILASLGIIETGSAPGLTCTLRAYRIEWCQDHGTALWRCWLGPGVRVRTVIRRARAPLQNRRRTSYARKVYRRGHVYVSIAFIWRSLEATGLPACVYDGAYTRSSPLLSPRGWDSMDTKGPKSTKEYATLVFERSVRALLQRPLHVCSYPAYL